MANQILLSQLNTTCDACASNSTISSVVNATLINTMKQCKGPIYEVISIIANHSKDLFTTVNTWKDAFNEPENDNSVTATNTNPDINELYLCNIPTSQSKS